MLLGPGKDKTLDHGATSWNVLQLPQFSGRMFMVLVISFECFIKKIYTKKIIQNKKIIPSVYSNLKEHC